MRILVIEDEKKVAAALKAGLEDEHYDVTVSSSGEEGFFLASAHDFDLIVLDIMLPGHDGYDVLKTLRANGIRTPVLVLSARDALEDRVKGLDLGADDYLAKPFAFPELLARIRAMLRRGRGEPVLRLKCDDLDLDLATRRVARGGTNIELTAREFELLEYLIRSQGHVVSREMIARDVWKETARATPLDNVIDVHVARLRRKIDEPFNRKLLKTIRGIGFLLQQEDT